MAASTHRKLTPAQQAAAKAKAERDAKRAADKAKEAARDKSLDPLVSKKSQAAATTLQNQANALTGARVNVGPTQTDTNLLNQYGAIAQQYGQRSGETQQALDMSKQLATQGYNSQQMQGAREQQEKGMQSSYQTQAANMQNQQARSGVRGAAGAAQMATLNRQQMEAQGNLEQGQMVNNANFMAQQNSQYGQQLASNQQAEYGRALGSTEAQNNAVKGQEAQDASREQENYSRNVDQAKSNLGITMGVQSAEDARNNASTNALIGLAGAQGASGQHIDTNAIMNSINQSKPDYKKAAQTTKKKTTKR